jgi:hypothetical protein
MAEKEDEALNIGDLDEQEGEAKRDEIGRSTSLRRRTAKAPPPDCQRRQDQ